MTENFTFTNQSTIVRKITAITHALTEFTLSLSSALVKQGCENLIGFTLKEIVIAKM